MRFKGGYNILLGGKPAGTIKVIPEPRVLYLPLRSQRFVFSELCVTDGQKVSKGDVLAKDPMNYAVPLLAPRAGTVTVKEAENHIKLECTAQDKKHTRIGKAEPPHIVQEMGAAGIKRYKLLQLGAWHFFYDAYNQGVPDPLGTPQAIIISTLSLEPFVTRGDVQLKNRLLNFTRGLEQLQSLLEYQPIYLILPEIKSELAALILERIRGYASVKLLEIPLIYPYDNFAILARKLGLKSNGGPIWGVRTEGVLAADRALTFGKACTVKIISVGGISVNSPVHLKVMAGYPIQSILEKYVLSSDARVINGGILTGNIFDSKALGLDVECRGITVVPEPPVREFLGFIRPGWDRSSYSGCFLSSARKNFRERFTAAVRGERRPCISCNFCEEVCPAGIMPYLIHKYLYRDLIEEAEEARVDLCIECGLCSFVCPSKIDLRSEFIKLKGLIEKEKEEILKEKERQEKLRQEEATQQEAMGDIKK
ncbi:MAG: 4Fe-4S dicluster domain-containing protein [Planctomycetota bacterium]|jgi:Na+-transporting NADH:ubiquinone oxidoreductase subunit A